MKLCPKRGVTSGSLGVPRPVPEDGHCPGGAFRSPPWRPPSSPLRPSLDIAPGSRTPCGDGRRLAGLLCAFGGSVLLPGTPPGSRHSLILGTQDLREAPPISWGTHLNHVSYSCHTQHGPFVCLWCCVAPPVLIAVAMATMCSLLCSERQAHGLLCSRQQIQCFWLAQGC